MTPQERLLARRKQRLHTKLNREFDKKFFIGDIAITDDEFSLLLDESQKVVNRVMQTYMGFTDSPVLAVTLVQIGIRCYDGSLWSHVHEALTFPNNQRSADKITEAFLHTLKVHQKYIPEDNTGCVKAILLHGFVSNYYSKGLFELLFSYYTHDLERDIHRNTKEQMQALMDTLSMKQDEDDKDLDRFFSQFMGHGSRAYKLRAQTLQAISVRPVHSRVRLRRLIRLIDQAFWKGQVPKNPVSRLTILFKEWINESPAFAQDYKLYQSGGIKNRGKKHFSIPYLFADLLDGEFSVKFPAQIVPPAYAEGLCWELKTNQRSLLFPADTYPALTGYKTEEALCNISREELFGYMRARLVCDGEQVRRFPDFPEKNVRFFDMEGDYSVRLFAQPMCAFTCSQEPLHSSAFLDTVCFGDMTRWDFEFEQGDLVVLPDGSGMVVGEIFNDGFLPRGKVDCAIYLEDDGTPLPVYAKIPELLLTLPEEKIPGTALFVDGQKYSLGRCRLSSFKAGDTKGVHAVLLPFSQFSFCRRNGVHEVILDVPGSNTAHGFSYVYVDGLEVDFDGAPYIFQERGTVVFPDHIHADADLEKICGENGFQFELSGDQPTLPVVIDRHIQLELKIPLFSWSVDEENWHILPAGELWHTEFFQVHKLYLRSPSKKVSIYPSTEGLDDEDESDRRIIDVEEGKDGIFTADLTRFQSWFTRDIMRNDVFIKIGKTEVCFATVYTRSLLSSFDVQADYEASELHCICDIIGKADYYIDIVHLESGTVLADKALLTDGQLHIQDRLRSGQYQFTIYEAEEDDSGFDEPIYEELYTETRKLVNRNDISGQILSLQRFRAAHHSNLYTNLRKEYLIVNLEKTDRNIYTGQLLVNREESDLRVEITFLDKNDLRFMSVGFWDEEEGIYIPFLFDSDSGTLVQVELPGLRPSQKYRRYRMLDEDTFVFFGLTYADMPPFDETKYPSNNTSQPSTGYIAFKKGSHPSTQKPAFHPAKPAEKTAAPNNISTLPSESKSPIIGAPPLTADEPSGASGDPQPSREFLLKKEPASSVSDVKQCPETHPEEENNKTQADDANTPVSDSSPTPIEKMGLSIRTYNVLRRAGILTTADLDGMSFDDLFRIRNMGKTNVQELTHLSSKFNFTIV